MTIPVSITSTTLLTSARNIDAGPHWKQSGSAPQDDASRLLGALQSNLGINANNEAFKTQSEEYENAVLIGKDLKRAADSMKDGMRGEKISRLEQRIERLKEMLKFATPEQARKLIKELKSISKEFKAVAKDLGEAASSLSSISSGSVPTPSANTAAAVPVTPGVDASAPPGSTQPIDVTRTETGQASSTAPANTFREFADPNANKDELPGNATETQSRPLPAGIAETNENGVDDRKQQVEVSTAITAYTSVSNEDDNRVLVARKSLLQQQRDALKELAADIKYITARLKQLLKQSSDADDKDAAKDLKKINKLLHEGKRELAHPDLNDGLAGVTSQVSDTAPGAPAPTGVLNLSTGTNLSVAPVNVVSDISV